MEPIYTKRLKIRPFREHDNTKQMDWFFDAKVMGMTISGIESSYDSLKKRIQRYIEHQNKYGFSKWLVIDRLNEKYIGDCGIYRISDDSLEINDIGFRLSAEYWGKGIGYEMVEGCINRYFEMAKGQSLYAHALVNNEKSFNLLKKFHFQELKLVKLFGHDYMRFILKSSSLLSNN